MELHAHRDLFTALREGLVSVSFLSLWGRSLALYGGTEWRLIDPRDEAAGAEDCIALRLDPHLQQLSDSFALPKPAAAQFQLFPALGVAVDVAANTSTGRRKHG